MPIRVAAPGPDSPVGSEAVEMFFFFGGGGTFSEVVGQSYTLDCPYCHNIRPWDLLKMENRFSVFFIPVAHWGARFFAVCPICSTAARIDSREQARYILDTVTTPDVRLRDELLRRAATEGIRL